MSDHDAKMEQVVTRPGRASCFLHQHLSERLGYTVLALDARGQWPSLVAVQPADRLLVWEVLGPTGGDSDERRRGPRCEFAAEYVGTFDTAAKSWGRWRLVAEYPAPAFEAPAHKSMPPPVLSGKRQPRSRS